MSEKRYYFTTRDLLMMAALAALGGVSSTYISTIGRLLHSFVGVPGSMQWAAGLHVLWLTLAVGLTGKQGAGTITGILKGVVELLSGNAHGLIVILVDVAAGVLVDVGFLPFRNKERLPGYLLGGGLSSASNVFIFQLFAALPADTLAYGAMLAVGGMAGLSGVVFGGFLAFTLLSALRRAGVVKDRPPQTMGRKAHAIFLGSTLLLTLALMFYIRGISPSAAATVHIGGAVETPYDYPNKHQDIPTITAESTLRDVTSSYSGIPLRELIARAEPQAGASLVLAKANDGYAFFITMDEVQNNPSLLLSPQDQDGAATYNITGAENSKAWVRGVIELTVSGAAELEITGALEHPAPYNPDDWQAQMENATLDLGQGTQKLQGIPLKAILTPMGPEASATTLILHTTGNTVSLPLGEALDNNDIAIYTLIQDENVTFVIAQSNGDILATQVTQIEVQ